MSECNIVKDLMPLVVDGAASEDSRKLVTDHVSKCEKCALAYADCKRELPAKDPPMNYGEAARALRKWRRIRKALLIGLTTIVTIAVLFAGRYAWNALTVWYNATLPLDEYEVLLVRMQDGQVNMIVLPDEEGLQISVVERGPGSDTVCDVKTGVIRQYGRKCMETLVVGRWQDGVFWADYAPDVIRRSFSFTDGEKTRVLYTAGDEIPLASPELEALYALAASCYGKDMTDEQRAAYDAQYALVPEFQPE